MTEDRLVQQFHERQWKKKKKKKKKKQDDDDDDDNEDKDETYYPSQDCTRLYVHVYFNFLIDSNPFSYSNIRLFCFSIVHM